MRYITVEDLSFYMIREPFLNISIIVLIVGNLSPLLGKMEQLRQR